MSQRLLLTWLTVSFAAAQQQATTSIFVPDEFQSNTFDVSVVGSDATATTFEFYPGCEFGPCGPVTLIQGPGTAIFTEDLGPSLITTVWSCKLWPIDAPTTADCSLTSTATFGCCEGTDTKQYPPGTGFAFPMYKAIVTAGTLAGSNAAADSTAGGTLATSGSTRGMARPTESVFTASGDSSTTDAAETTSTSSRADSSQSGSSQSGSSRSDSSQVVSSTGSAGTTSTADATASTQSMSSGTPSADVATHQEGSGRLVEGAVVAAVIGLAGILV